MDHPFDVLPQECETILQEAQWITSGERQKTYGHPLEDWTRTASLWIALLGIEITAFQAVLCMEAVKLLRLCKMPSHRDSMVDVAGYARCLAQIQKLEI